MKRRIAALLLVLSLLVAYMPTVAFALDGEAGTTNDVVVAPGDNEQDQEDVIVDPVEDEVVDPVEDEAETPAPVDEEEKEAEEAADVAKDQILDGPNLLEKLNLKLKDLLDTRLTVFITGDDDVLEIVKAHKNKDGKYYVEKPENPNKKGYAFQGWYRSITRAEISKVVWSDCNCKNRPSGEVSEGTGKKHTAYSPVMYAKWEADEYILKLHNGKKVETVVVKYGEDFKVACPESFSVDGKYFAGWAASKHGNVLFNDNEKTNVVEMVNDMKLKPNFVKHNQNGTNTYTIDLYARWDNTQKFNVTYHENLYFPLTLLVDVKEMPKDGKIAKGATLDIPDETPYVGLKELSVDNKFIYDSFVCWNTKADGTGTSYTSKDEIANIQEDVDLYAIWKLDHYKIKYELNGGDEDAISFADKYYLAGYAQYKVLPTPTRTGYDFVGWHLKEDLSDDAFTGLTATTTGDLTLYAEWAKSKYTITFLDGFGGVTRFTQEYGDKTLTPPDPQRANMKFKGWTPAVAEFVTKNATYSAEWTYVSDTDFDIDVNTVLTGDNNPLIMYILIASTAFVGVLALVLAKLSKAR